MYQIILRYTVKKPEEDADQEQSGKFVRVPSGQHRRLRWNPVKWVAGKVSDGAKWAAKTVKKAASAVTNVVKHGFTYDTGLLYTWGTALNIRTDTYMKVCQPRYDTGATSHKWDLFAYNYDPSTGSALQDPIELFHAGQRGTKLGSAIHV